MKQFSVVNRSTSFPGDHSKELSIQEALKRISMVTLQPQITFFGVGSMASEICQHVIAIGLQLVIYDAFSHPLVCKSRAVRQYGIAAYIGMPVRDPNGVIIATVHVTDSKLRNWKSDEIDEIRDIALHLEQLLCVAAHQSNTR